MKLFKYILLFLLLPYQGQGQAIINSYRYSAPAGCADADGTAWINAVIAAGVTPTAPQQTGMCNCVINGKANGWWSTRIAVYFPVFSNASANAINAKNPGTYNLTYSGSPTHTSNGIQWGSPAYANTGILATTFNINSLSFCVYIQTNSTTTSLYELGSFGSRAISINVYNNSTTYDAYAAQSAGSGFTRSGTTLGMHAMTRTNSNVVKMFKNGTQAGSTSSTISGVLTAITNLLGAYNTTTSGVSAGGHTNRKGSYYDFGSGLTDPQEASHYTDIQALHTVFGIQQ